MAFNKTTFAFLQSAAGLYRRGRQVYFWTLTFKKVMPDWYYGRLINKFYNAMDKASGNVFYGVHVNELHKSHGIHYHALTPCRVSQAMVRRIGARFGIGIVHVKKADKNAPQYLSKYLTKAFGEERFGVHKWGKFGGYKGTSVRDVVCESVFTRNMSKIFGGIKVPMNRSTWVFNQSRLWGNVEEWPEKCRVELRTIIWPDFETQLKQAGLPRKDVMVKRMLWERFGRTIARDYTVKVYKDD